MKPSNASRVTNQFRRLTNYELQDRRVKGLYFCCDQKFAPGHRCLAGRYKGLWVDKNNNINDSEDGHVHLDSVEVPLNSMVGFTTIQTLGKHRRKGNSSAY